MPSTASQPLLPASTQSPLRELLALALPTVFQMASYTAMQFMDTWMLARSVGTSAPAAAANAGGVVFSLLSFGWGILLVVNTLVSQNFGRRAFDQCGRYLWQGVWFALVYSAALLPLIFVLPRVFVAFGHSADMVAMESTFLRIMLATSVLALVRTAFGQFLLATNRPNLVLLSSVIGVSANGVAAYVFLFGKLGVKPMGITGAAWAQVIGTGVELATIVVFALANRQKRNLYRSLDWKPRGVELCKLLSVGFGSGLQWAAEVTAWTLFANWVFGVLGQTAMEANTFMFRYVTITFMPALGISSAVTSLVGRYIGMGRPDLAMQRAHLGFKVTLVYLVICGTVYFVFRNSLIGIFTTDPDVLRMGATLMIFAAFYELFDGMYIVYYGALRGAGDTFVPALATAGLCWSIMLGGGYLAARFAPQWSVGGPWAIASVYGIALGLFMWMRFRQGAWKTIDLTGDDSNQRGVSDRFPELQKTTSP